MKESTKNYEDETFVTQYAKNLEDNAYNALYERPATLSLIPTHLKGLRVLDIGCGPGLYLDTLVERGADVTAFDASDRMVALAQKRHPSLPIFQYAASGDMKRFESAMFDFLLAPLVFDYIEDWAGLFKELNRILKDGGSCAFSVPHPMEDYTNNNLKGHGSYFAVELLTEEWKTFNVQMQTYRRSLSNIFASILDSGFQVEKVIEPQPTAACKDLYPETYDRLLKHPAFICFKIRKTSDGRSQS